MAGVVRIDPICMSIRGYSGGVDINMPLREMTTPTMFTATAIINNQGHVDVCMISGDLTLSHAKSIKKQFKAMGMQSGEWRRPNGKRFHTC